MKLLLDTHTFIWWDSASTKLPAHILELLQSIENELFLSTASVWEMQIKSQLGKLHFDVPYLFRSCHSERGTSEESP